MSRKKHDAVFDDVLSDLDAPSDASGPPAPSDGSRSRFLRRSTALGERAAGGREEKVLHWVDPARCRMWARHNRAYELLSEENCRDLIDGIRAQGQQEFPAIVRRVKEGDHEYEVICGARRHFAVSWLRANNYPQFRYLVEVRDLSDEEAFRLSDIENRDREDISDFERARDYANAIGLYYGGRQKAMADRLEVSESWLSRYLTLARLPEEVVAAFPTLREIRELHARLLKPLLAEAETRAAVLAEAGAIVAERAAGGPVLAAPHVVSRLKAAGQPSRPAAPAPQSYAAGDGTLTLRRTGKRLVIEMPGDLSRDEIEAALADALDDHFGAE